ncbi:hypothetical protein NDU88_011108 [Pleurodeles waltl]|uniref:Uncharacterized protein n=1 Tax=Pleurodeles waltl TaxID=8319 RepID=A0AAV7S5A3_PLEWA|nr:hypothetical protein NDU88_011108 [Pleurodeles waltl]
MSAASALVAKSPHSGRNLRMVHSLQYVKQKFCGRKRNSKNNRRHPDGPDAVEFEDRSGKDLQEQQRGSGTASTRNATSNR